MKRKRKTDIVERKRQRVGKRGTERRKDKEKERDGESQKIERHRDIQIQRQGCRDRKTRRHQCRDKKTQRRGQTVTEKGKDLERIVD